MHELSTTTDNGPPRVSVGANPVFALVFAPTCPANTCAKGAELVMKKSNYSNYTPKMA